MLTLPVQVVGPLAIVYDYYYCSEFGDLSGRGGETSCRGHEVEFLFSNFVELSRMSSSTFPYSLSGGVREVVFLVNGLL